MGIWVKENKTWLIKISLMIIFVIPFGVYALSSIPLFPIGGNNDWAGFWGGYLGAIIGGIITLLIFRSTIRHENDIREEDRKIEFSKELIKLSSQYSFDVAKSINISHEYAVHPIEENNVKMNEAIHSATRTLQELGLFILVYEKKYPILSQIDKEYDEAGALFKAFTECIRKNAEDIFGSDNEELRDTIQEKSDEVYDKINRIYKIVANIINELL